MAGKGNIDPKYPGLRRRCDPKIIYGYSKDVWKQIPAKVMFENGVTWMCLISLDLSLDGVLRDLPVSTGLAIRRDIQGVEEFFSLISGEEVRMENGFVDLTTLAILAGYKFQSKKMTAKGVQVQGTLLNKCVYTGDYCWGMRWKEIPENL